MQYACFFSTIIEDGGALVPAIALEAGVKGCSGDPKSGSHGVEIHNTKDFVHGGDIANTKRGVTLAYITAEKAVMDALAANPLYHRNWETRVDRMSVPIEATNSIVYTIKLSNRGQGAAYNIEVENILPLNIIPDVGVIDPQTVAELGVGESISIEIEGVLNANGVTTPTIEVTQYNVDDIEFDADLVFTHAYRFGDTVNEPRLNNTQAELGALQSYLIANVKKPNGDPYTALQIRNYLIKQFDTVNDIAGVIDWAEANPRIKTVKKMMIAFSRHDEVQAGIE